MNAELRRAKTRRKLVDAAHDVIARKGAANATIEDFVSAAGIARGTFYNYFQSAAELVDAAARDVAAAVDDEIAGELDALEDPALELAMFGLLTTRKILIEPHRAWVGAHAELLDLGQQAAYAARFDEIVRRGAQSRRFHAVDIDAARALSGAASRAAMQVLTTPGMGEAKALEVLALMLRALGTPPDEASGICLEAARRVRDGLKRH